MHLEHQKNLLTLGYSVIKNNKPEMFNMISESILEIIHQNTDRKILNLENFHEAVGPQQTNSTRMKIIDFINKDDSIKLQILNNIKKELIDIIGPDIAVQKNINVVITQPLDKTSQIPLHSDTLTGHSIFELVIWIPLTKVYGTQSLFILPLEIWKKTPDFWSTGELTINALMKKYQNDFIYLNLNPFDIVLFWHHLPHGNVTNQESISRCSLNFRIKNLFSPYGDKGLGDYFSPWNMGAITELALSGIRNENA